MRKKNQNYLKICNAIHISNTGIETFKIKKPQNKEDDYRCSIADDIFVFVLFVILDEPF